MRAVCVAGARPNFMKIKPVLDALGGRGVETVFVHAGQHYDHELSGVFFADLGLRAPDRELEIGSGTHAEQTARGMLAFEPLVRELQPDVVIVVGDVNATLACALVTAKLPPKLAHVEAGLRSGDWTMPEEVNRVLTDRVSDVLLAPSPDAVDNLRGEGIDPARVHLVGNVMVDTLLANVERARQRPILSELGLSEGAYGLVTLHRPATVDDPLILADVLGALGEARELPLVFPAHPRTREQLRGIAVPPSNMRVVAPLGYLDFVALEAGARLVVTDSGGVQEETTVLGVPCLTVRDTTERPITVTEGTNTVVGRDPGRVAREIRRVLDEGIEARRPELWDGRAAERIADVLTA